MADVGAQVFRFFRQRGYSPAAAAGIVGNFQQESSLRPDAAGGGLDQGQGSRYHPGGLQQQLAGILGELQGSERGTAQAIKGASDPRKAALIFSQRFERPGIPNNPARERYAAEALKRYSGINARAASAGGEGPQLQTTTTPGATDPEALSQALAEVKRLSGPAVLAAGASPARPSFAAGSTAPRGSAPPAPLTPKPAAQPDIAKLLEAAISGGPTQTSSVTPGTAPPEAAAPAGGGAPARGGYPLGKVGKVIGLPYQGTHTLFGNWESDNAVDIAAPKGTPVYATENGTIGSQIGPLSSSDPKLLGLRLHLKTGGNEWYYAHLSKILVKPGERVREGQLLGYSGEANGVAHLHLASKSGSPVGLTKKH